MLKRGQGKIVNIVDVAAERPWPQFLTLLCIQGRTGVID